jgi:hypothetical protein
MRDLSRAAMAARERAELRGRAGRALLRRLPVVTGLFGLAVACLNPQPDEEPTFVGLPPPTDVAPAPETCANNPLLAGCALSGQPPSADSPGAGGGAGTELEGSAGTAGSAGSAGSGGDAGRDCDAERDAGPVDAARGTADAG